MKKLYRILALLFTVFAFNAAQADDFSVTSVEPGDGEEVAGIPTDGRITFSTTDDALAAKVTGIIIDEKNSNGSQEEFGSFTSEYKDEQGRLYWFNYSSPVYFLEGHTYYLSYTIYDADNKRLATGTVKYIGTTDPESLIDYTFAPIETEILYSGSQEKVDEIEVRFHYDENVYVNFNGYIAMSLFNAAGERVPATFLSRSLMSEPQRAAFAIKPAASVNWNFNETYTVKIPTMFGDAEWYGLTSDHKFYTGKANAPCEFEVNLAENGVLGVDTVGVAAASGPVYNLQGIKVADSQEGLPEGIYNCGGKKIVVKTKR